MSLLVFACSPRSWVTGDCNEGCQNPATCPQAGFCQGNPLGVPVPSATPATLHGTYILLELAIAYSDLLSTKM